MDYQFYKWIAKSNDGAFEDCSSIIFSFMEDCYDNMRDAVLEKMKWNTEWEDVMDMTDKEVIGYEVEFGKDFIKHTSYSGTYLYRVVPCDMNGKVPVKAVLALDRELGIKHPQRSDKEVREFVEGFVHGRYSKNDLESSLSEFVGKEIHLEDTADKEDKFCDYMLTCQIYGVYDNEAGYFLDLDIYYLPTRYGQMYITETNVEKY